MKFRIKEENSFFYPQYKILFWWINFKVYSMTHNSSIPVSFFTLSKARDFLNEYLTTKHESQIKIHEYPNKYNPDALCNVTAAKTQSQCGTTCCTPNED